MGKIVELTVRKGYIRRGMRCEYTIKAEISDDAEIHAAKAQLEGLIDGWLSPYISEAPQTKPAVKKLSVDEVKSKFSEDLQNLLDFEDAGEYYKLKPREYLGAENFAKVAQIVRDVGGEYVSAGKESHFRIPKRHG
ncbi:MAG: hypothetical protein QXK47_02475 [Candidatus Bathyarchaeia archaeon]